MKVGERYENIVNAFNSIRDDAKKWWTSWTTARFDHGKPGKLLDEGHPRRHPQPL